MSQTDYKLKYTDLKSKFHSTVDLAWRLGYEQGLKDAQLDQAQQQVQQADAMAQAQAGAPQPGQPGEDEAPTEVSEPSEEQPASANPNEDELGQHIEKLENMLGKSEISFLELQDLKKTLNDIRSLQVQISLTKSLSSIKNTRLAKSQPSFSPRTKANLPAPAQKALSMQQEIVDNIFKKWETEANQTSSGIAGILGIEGLTKHDHSEE
jgi:hypothetical protein